MIDVIKSKIQQVDFWVTIIQDLITGITIGATLGLIGYFIWKKQNLYSKKFEVYINVISIVEEVYTVITHSLINKDIKGLDKFFEFDDDLISDLKKNKLLFVSFFGKRYNDKIEYFVNINKHLESVEITFKDGASSFTKFFKPEEYTPEILNLHKQDVINKMHEYINELKLVSRGLKRYALLK